VALYGLSCIGVGFMAVPFFQNARTAGKCHWTLSEMCGMVLCIRRLSYICGSTAFCVFKVLRFFQVQWWDTCAQYLVCWDCWTRFIPLNQQPCGAFVYCHLQHST
jgi:hypothetical protein